MQSQFNLTGLVPYLDGDKLTLELDSIPHDHVRNIATAIGEASGELGLTESQSESIVNDTLNIIQTMLLAKLLTARRIF